MDLSGVRRDSGIGVMDRLFWGTHMCQLFDTKKDLIQVLVPYFKAGLESNELCIWVTAKPVEVDEARAVLHKELANIDDYMAKKQIEILDYKNWYIREGIFDPDTVLNFWKAKESIAIDKGFDGLRVFGNMAWVANSDWKTLVEYEVLANAMLPRRRIIEICAYPNGKHDTGKIIDLVSNHQFILFRRAGQLMCTWNSPNKCVLNYRRNGLSYAEIGRRLDLSRERIRQIMNAQSKAKRKRPSNVADVRLTTGEAAEILNVHINTVRRWSNNGTLPTYYIGSRGDRRFRKQDLDNFFQRKAMSGLK